jgi:hypothetical protein
MTDASDARQVICRQSSLLKITDLTSVMCSSECSSYCYFYLTAWPDHIYHPYIFDRLDPTDTHLPEQSPPCCIRRRAQSTFQGDDQARAHRHVSRFFFPFFAIAIIIGRNNLTV